MGLQLKPNCENCNASLPPSSLAARICSFECTFCETCVRDVLANVCPNCGGGFCARPVRPAHDYKGGFYLGEHPASTVPKHRPVDPSAHERFAAPIKDIPPERR